MKIKKGLLFVIAIVLAMAISACDSSSDEPKKEDKQEPRKETKKTNEEDSTAYTADNAFVQMEKSGLMTGNGEDVTDGYKGSEGLKKAIKTAEADILEFKIKEDAKKYENTDMSAYAVDKIYVLVKKK